MAIHIGVNNLDGHTAPAIGAVQSRESEETLGTEEERDASGKTKFFVPHKYTRKQVDISGVGDAEIALVVAESVTAGTLSLTRAKQTEFAGSLPKFERSGIVLTNLS